jgi:hypothetical protein
MQHIARFNDKTSLDVTFTDVAASTGGFPTGMTAGAILLVRQTSTAGAVVLTFGARPHSSSSEFFVCADSSDSPITLTVQPDRCYALPDDLFAAAYVAATAEAGKTATCSIYMKG